MKQINQLKVSLALLLLMATYSCDPYESELPGKWEAMKWEKKSDDCQYNKEAKAYLVPAAGADYLFVCQNYTQPWLEGIELTCDTTVLKSYTYHNEHWDFHHDTIQNCTFAIQHDSLLLHFAPNETLARSFVVHVTAGDIFDSFTFHQLKSK